MRRRGPAPLRLGIRHPHGPALLPRRVQAGVGEERAHEAARFCAAHGRHAQGSPRLRDRHQGEVHVHDAPELLQHLVERLFGTYGAGDGLEGPAQLLGELPPLALPLHGRFGVQPPALAGDRLAQHVHDLPSKSLVPASRAAHLGEPALDVVQQAVDVQLGVSVHRRGIS